MPLAPSIITELSLSAISGRILKSSCMCLFLLTMSSKVNPDLSVLRKLVISLISLNVSTPPIIVPFLSFKTAVFMLIGIFSPVFFIMYMVLFIKGLPVVMVSFNAQE